MLIKCFVIQSKPRVDIFPRTEEVEAGISIRHFAGEDVMVEITPRGWRKRCLVCRLSRAEAARLL